MNLSVDFESLVSNLFDEGFGFILGNALLQFHFAANGQVACFFYFAPRKLARIDPSLEQFGEDDVFELVHFELIIGNEHDVEFAIENYFGLATLEIVSV